MQERVSAGGHDVAELVVVRRYGRGLTNFHEIYQPLADVWSVYDNSDSSEPTLIASGSRDRSVEIRQPDAWATFSEVDQ